MKYRRQKKQSYFRLWLGIKKASICFLFLTATVLGTLFAFLGIAGVQLEIKLILFTIIATLAISIIYGICKAKIGHLADNIFIEEDDDSQYELCYESESDCAYFNQETAKYFGKDFIDGTIVESWRAKCPKGFIYMRNKKKEPCAAICLFALSRSFMEQFIKGRLVEGDIKPSDILDFRKSFKSKDIYLSTIIVIEPHLEIGHRRTLAMVWCIAQYLSRVYGLKRKRIIYAIPINKASKNLLKKLGFQIASFANQRKDGHDLYSFVFERKSFEKVMQRIGDYSNICSISKLLSKHPRI